MYESRCEAQTPCARFLVLVEGGYRGARPCSEAIVGDLNYSTTQLQLTPAVFCALCRTAQPAHMSDASTDALMSNTNADI